MTIFIDNKKINFLVKFILTFFSLLSVFPFILISKYNLPLADEFIAMHFRKIMNFKEYQNLLLNTWSGRYTSNLLENIYPLKINFLFYQLIPVAALLLIFLLIFMISRKIFIKNHFWFSTGIYIIFLNYFPSVADIIYYVPALIIYTISFLLLLLLSYIWLLKIKEDYKIIFFIIINIIILGTVELYIPVLIYFSAILLYRNYKTSKPNYLYFVNLIIIVFIAYYLLSSNGNLKRLDEQKNESELAANFYNYFYSLFYWTKEYLIAIPFIVLLIYLLKDGLRIISSKIKDIHIYILIGGYLILVLPLFFINLSLYNRIGNVFFVYFMLIILTICIKTIPNSLFSIKKGRLFLFLSLFMLFVYTGNIRKAYTDIYNGYTKNLSTDLKKRYQYLEKNKNKNYLELDKIKLNKYILSIQDVNDTHDTSLIIGMYKLYFNIDSLVIK